MAGVPLIEFYFQELIKCGFEYLRSNPSQIDMIFARMKEPLLVQNFGQSFIDQLKQLFVQRQISLIQDINLVPQNLPCVSFTLLSSSELLDQSYFGIFAGSLEEPMTDASRLTATITSLTYELASGFVSTSSEDVLSVNKGQTVIDSAGNSFEVLSPILDGSTGQAGFSVVPLSLFTTGDTKVLAFNADSSTSLYSMPYSETIQIGCHSEEKTNFARYLYYIVSYILQSSRVRIEGDGFLKFTIKASDFTRNSNLMPDLAVSRYMTVTAQTYYEWNASPQITSALFDGHFLVEKDVWIKRDDTYSWTTL